MHIAALYPTLLIIKTINNVWTTGAAKTITNTTILTSNTIMENNWIICSIETILIIAINTATLAN